MQPPLLLIKLTMREQFIYSFSAHFLFMCKLFIVLSLPTIKQADKINGCQSCARGYFSGGPSFAWHRELAAKSRLRCAKCLNLKFATAKRLHRSARGFLVSVSVVKNVRIVERIHSLRRTKTLFSGNERLLMCHAHIDADTDRTQPNKGRRLGCVLGMNYLMRFFFSRAAAIR